jgi:YHS domain-containing protein
MTCPWAFVQGPERYLKMHGISLACPVHPDRAAVLDSAHKAEVNHEVYFFSDQAALARFRANPLRYCGTVTDPVNRRRFRPTWFSPRYDFLGRPYFFTSRATRATFKAYPDSFAVRRGE